MGLLAAITRWVTDGRPAGPHFSKKRARHPSKNARRRCWVEQLEPRQLLAGDIHLGSVYFEEATGDDSEADVLEVTFAGGAAGTQLAQLTIDGDKKGNGRLEGDPFFDTESGGLGAFQHVGLTIVSHEGFEVSGVTLVDGGSQLVFDFVGFDAGEKLVFSVDVDEISFIEDDGTVSATSIVEGGEFERSRLSALFIAPHFENTPIDTVYWDAFDDNFATAASTAGSMLDLPSDAYRGDDDLSDRTAGAVGLATQIPLPIAISGTVFVDANLDNRQDPGETDIAGVPLSLWMFDTESGELTDTGRRAVTDGLRDYEFNSNTDPILPGRYEVRETQPDGYFSVGAAPGTVDGLIVGIALDADTLGEIDLVGGQHSIDNDFAEALPADLSGFVYHDANNDGLRDTGEQGIADVGIQIVPVSTLDGSTDVVVVSTDETGLWMATGLAPGEYRVVEPVQPAGYLDGLDTAGTVLGVTIGTAGNPGDAIEAIVLGSGVAGIDYNFGELLPSRISGQVHASTDDDCVLDPHDIPLADVQIDLLDADGTLLQTTLTDGEGRYVFDHLAPGEYQVIEHQPADYFDGDEQLGSAGGLVVGDDHVANVVLTSGTDAVSYNFCEHVGASFSGWVYHDADNDGLRDAAETGIGGVTLLLLDANGNATGATSTDKVNLGYYEFADLPQGTHGVAEVQPAGYLDGIDTAGDRGGTVDSDADRITGLFLSWGQSGAEYNFGELLPGSIRGAVHANVDSDCLDDEHSSPIAGVVVELYDAKDLLIATTVTDDAGRYEFTDLAPGVYSVRERQPDGFFGGQAHVGSDTGVVLGENRIGQIQIGSGEHLVDANFCEVPPATISGYVFQDGGTIVTSDGNAPGNLAELRDGRRTDDDRPLENVVLELRHGEHGTAILGGAALKGTYGEGPIRAVTDANGFYEFAGLPPETYAVYQIQPEGLFDGIDTPGTAGGLAVNSHGPVDSGIVSQLLVDPNDDAILAIPLTAGTASVENNFSEVDVVADPEPPISFPPISEPPARAAVLPVTFVHPLPPVPEPTPRLVPDPMPPIYGSAIAFTWHLSVIDAGWPRSIDPQQFLVRLTGSSVQHIAWQIGRADQTSWTLLQIDQLSGESQRTALFGSSKGVPVAGDFNGDGRADLGLFLDGEWFIDINGNGRWDKDDLWAKLGEEGDKPVTGDWDGDGKTDIGIFGPAWAGDARAIEHEAGLPDRQNQLADRQLTSHPLKGRWKNIPPQQREAIQGTRVMKLTSQGAVRTDVIDHVFRYGEAGDSPVAGDWNGDGIDTIGVFHHGMWRLDTNGDGRFTAEDQRVEFGQEGDVPVVGDWDGDGIDALGVYRNGTWILDTNGDRHLDARDHLFQSGGIGLPVVGDWDGDGREEPGLFHGGPQAAMPSPAPE